MSDMNNFNNNNGQIIDPLSKSPKTSKILSIISLCLNVVVFSWFIYLVIVERDEFAMISSNLDVINFIIIPVFIVSVILMIVARVKDRRNKIAFVLMWVYIAEAIIMVFSMLAVILFLVLMCKIFGCV